MTVKATLNVPKTNNGRRREGRKTENKERRWRGQIKLAGEENEVKDTRRGENER